MVYFPLCKQYKHTVTFHPLFFFFNKQQLIAKLCQNHKAVTPSSKHHNITISTEAYIHIILGKAVAFLPH